MPEALRKKFDCFSAFMIALSITGMTLIAYEDNEEVEVSESAAFQIRGDLLAIMSAVSYAIYATYLKIKVPNDDSSFHFSYFLGFVGLFNDILVLPLFPIFHEIGLETFGWPSKHKLVLLTINAFLGTFISDYCWGKSVVLLGPFVTTLGMTVTFPLSVLADN